MNPAHLRNAKTGGLEKDFNLTSTQYSIVLLVFFVSEATLRRQLDSLQVSYVIFEIPSNLLLTRVRPSIYLSALCVLWGGVAACMAAVPNWHALAGVRFALGIAEAGFAPGVGEYSSPASAPC